MQNPISYLKQPYPINNDWRFQLRTAFIIGLFISVFLIVFEPFGLSNIQSDSKTYLFGGYGVVSFIILLIDLILLKQLFSSFFEEENWTIWKQLFFLWWIIFSIGLGNLGYTVLLFNIQGAVWRLIIRFQLMTLTIGLIPIIVTTIIGQNFYLKKNLKEAQQINSDINKQTSPATKTIEIVAENGKDHFYCQLSDLLFIGSEGNYVLIYHLQQEKLKKTILRNTLTNTEHQLSNSTSFLKTHRAFLVNLEKIANVTGNSQGLRVQFDETNVEVPVSRTYLSDFKQAWKNL